MTALAPCPFCKSHDVVEYMDDHEIGEPDFMVLCRQCFGSGPLIESNSLDEEHQADCRRKARDLWNSR
jgi:hypothetical protein